MSKRTKSKADWADWRAVIGDYCRGVNQRQCAERHGITPGRVHQLVHEHAAMLPLELQKKLADRLTKREAKVIADRAVKKPADEVRKSHCGFCGKDHKEVRKLIAGPIVAICDECVELCVDIIRDGETRINMYARYEALNAARIELSGQS